MRPYPLALATARLGCVWCGGGSVAQWLATVRSEPYQDMEAFSNRRLGLQYLGGCVICTCWLGRIIIYTCWLGPNRQSAARLLVCHAIEPGYRREHSRESSRCSIPISNLLDRCCVIVERVTTKACMSSSVQESQRETSSHAAKIRRLRAQSTD